MSGIFETHAHFDDHSFDEDRDEVISRVHETVDYVINCCASVRSLSFVPDMCERYDFMYFSAGLHPEEIIGVDMSIIDTVERAAMHPKCVAIGEIGFDYHFDDGESKELQAKWFEEQLILAQKLQKPVIIHSRDATADTIEMLKKYRPRGVMHCFSGSVETMREVIGLGMYIGLGGPVTFKNARHAVEVASAIPLERLLLETDAPYMAPAPFRGKRNDSSLIKYIAEKIAELRGITYEELLQITSDNAKTLFGIK